MFKFAKIVIVTSSVFKGLTFIAVLLLSATLHAQPDSGAGVVKAPPGSGLVIPDAPKSAEPSSNLDVSPSIFDDNFKRPGSLATPEINSNFGKPQVFQNPGDRVVDKLNKKNGEVATAIRKNQNFGEVRTGGKTVRIQYRDHEYPDGDVIRIFVNETVMRGGVLLDSSFEGFNLTLNKGINKIEFVALNQGTSGPNTAEFQVYSEDGTLLASNRWNLATGFRATILVIQD